MRPMMVTIGDLSINGVDSDRKEPDTLHTSTIFSLFHAIATVGKAITDVESHHGIHNNFEGDGRVSSVTGSREAG